jgi:serine/threonine protein kinase
MLSRALPLSFVRSDLISLAQEREIAAVARHCLEALHHIHVTCHTVHRDIKANNVLLSADGKVINRDPLYTFSPTRAPTYTACVPYHSSACAIFIAT